MRTGKLLLLLTSALLLAISPASAQLNILTRLRSVTSLPATCQAGDGVQGTDFVSLIASGHSALYRCTSTNVWELLVDTDNPTLAGVVSIPGTGSNQSILFNDNGVIGTDNGFTYDKINKTVSWPSAFQISTSWPGSPLAPPGNNLTRLGIDTDGTFKICVGTGACTVPGGLSSFPDGTSTAPGFPSVSHPELGLAIGLSKIAYTITNVARTSNVVTITVSTPQSGLNWPVAGTISIFGLTTPYDVLNCANCTLTAVTGGTPTSTFTYALSGTDIASAATAGSASIYQTLLTGYSVTMTRLVTTTNNPARRGSIRFAHLDGMEMRNQGNGDDCWLIGGVSGIDEVQVGGQCTGYLGTYLPGYHRGDTQTAPANPSSSTSFKTYVDSGTGKFTCLLGTGGTNCLPVYLGDPGSNGLVKRTALNTTTVATSADVIALWTGTCSSATFLRGDGACAAAGGAAPALSAITAATATNTINSANFPQAWQWQLTTNSTKAFSFAESTASTATSSDLVNISTLASSTLNPLTITALGTANGVRVNNIGDLTFLGTGITDLGTSGAQGTECANEGVTGTGNGLVAKLNTSNQCIKVLTTDLASVEGIVVKGGGTSGNAVIATSGVVSCTFSNATTVFDYVGVSGVTAGDCLDLGAAPVAGAQVLGRVLTSGLAATSQSVQVYARGALAIQGTTNRVTTAFANGVLTLSLPQDIATGSTVQFGAVKTTQLVTGTSGSSMIVQIADSNNATSVTGLLTVRGGDQISTANGSAGNILVRGGTSASTGTGAAGNVDIRAGQSTAAANKNGFVQVEGSWIKGVTYTLGNLQCFTGDNTVGDCGTSVTNFVGVALLSNGNTAVADILGTQVLVNYDATVSPVAGWFACSSATTGGKVTAQSGACAAGRTVGVIEAGGTNVTSGNITYAHF